ncbi:uncharacterized protein LOC119485262 [Sebastes umbrosus]|uniref:uncharacterized protein LOC119485262 n=1 Tax=Sebastes umbrosus TaxID=72105 RepID=UPI00189C8141|nr:uncharacterized protein LOC119485262 [Sebastes umbrosus]
MMKFIHAAVVVLSLLSVGQSAPVIDCERLVQPLEFTGREQLLGKWTYIAEATNIPASQLMTKMLVDSARTNITAAADESDIINLQTLKMFGRCFTVTSKMTVGNSTLSMDKPVIGSGVLLTTSCPDCTVSYSNYTIGGRSYQSIQLMSRRDKLTAAELQEFTKQVECVNLPAPAILDPEKGFCPDESPSQETEVIDMTKFMNDYSSEFHSFFDNIMNTKGGLQKLIKMLSSGIAGLKEY